MRLTYSNVSCGINELIIDEDVKLTKQNLDKALFSGGSRAMVVASIPTNNHRLLSFLKKNKFKIAEQGFSSSGTAYTFLVRKFGPFERFLQRLVRRRYWR